MRSHLTKFVTRLRKSGVRVSVAETLDAMAAVSATGLERDVLREALAATLVKDEGDRAAFDAAFDAHFPLLAADGSTGKGKQRGARTGGEGDASQASRAGSGTGSGAGSSSPPPRDDATTAPPQRDTKPRSASARAGRGEENERPAPRSAVPPSRDAATAARPREPLERAKTASGGDAEREASERGGEPAATRARIARRPFADLDPDALDDARAAAREIGRRFAARAARRERRTRRGRIDIRRTIRRAVARGGALVDLQRRGRRPGKPDLVVLCDVSGSVARASDLLLSLLAACGSAFTNVARFAYVDHLVPVDYEDGHIRPEGELDLYGFSDLGNVLAELESAAGERIDRRTVLLVLGDARNNRRPARADVLRRLARRARAVVWAVPEPRARWDTGDSALASYAPSCDRVVEATSLAGLAAAIREAAS
ncbi:MAG: VWA domain-containing protein [Candidatus Binatia bacterium]